MKKLYPVVFTETEKGFVAHVPDMNIDTQGDDLAEAVFMARDAIGLMGIDMQDDKKAIPEPSRIEDVKKGIGEVVRLVEIDFTEFRLENERLTTAS
jgi:predicted RNase H-like HicB family nuclease